MGLFHTSIANSQQLNNWAEDEVRATFSPGLSVRSSALGGYGLFFDSHHIPKQRNWNGEILRIPAGSVLSLETCRAIMRSCKQEKTQTLTFIQQCLKSYCSKAHVVSESSILVAYCVAFLVLGRLGRLSDLQSPSARFVRRYLDILMETKVHNLNNDDVNLLLAYVSEFPGNTLVQEVVRRLQDGASARFAGLINEKLLENKHPGIISANEVIQIETAIRSRELEIPDVCSSTKGGQGADFSISIKMVPILDFANHNNGLVNAYFDIDRSNNDVLLKLDPESFKRQAGQVHEVFISYSPVEEATRFLVTYGFIPRNLDSTPTFVDVPFWGHFADHKAENERWKDPNVLFAVRSGVGGQIDDVRICITDKKEVLSVMRRMMEKDDVTRNSEQEILSQFVTVVRNGLGEYTERLKRYKTWADAQKLEDGKSKNICELVEFGVVMAEKFAARYQEETRVEKQRNYSALILAARDDHEASEWDSLRLIPDYNEEEEHIEG